MSKFGWSLPPGCSTLPGEDAQAQKDEALFDKIFDVLANYSDADTDLVMANIDVLAGRIFALCGESYGEGYKHGMADEQPTRLGWAL